MQSFHGIFEHLQRAIETVSEKEWGFGFFVSSGRAFVHSKEVPKDWRMGDYAFPCFILKVDGKSPAEVARTLSVNIRTDEIIERVEAKGPYLNFFIHKDVLLGALIHSFKTPHEKSAERILIEYSAPNPHKEFHIGHFRNTVLGAALVNMFRHSGRDVVALNYYNDFGSHVAKCLWAYLKFHKGEEPKENKGAFLGKAYVLATRKLEEHPEYEPEVAEMLRKLEARDPDIEKLWKETRQWSLDQFASIYKELGVEFNDEIFESDILDKGKEMVSELVLKGVAKKSEGAVIVDMKAEKLDVLVLLKSDGAGLYATKDLALAKKKFEMYECDESIIITDVRQSFYFKQLFRVLQLYGLPQKMTHVGYELVTLPSGAMSSRAGDVVLYEELRDKAIDKAYEETRKRHQDWDEEKLRNTARVIAFAALKFGMIKFENNQVITFDLAQALSFEGDTGPYILYTHARINSIFTKARELGVAVDLQNVNGKLLREPQELELIHLMVAREDVFSRALSLYQPSQLAVHLVNVCHAFNTFYHHVQVVKCEDEQLRNTRFLLISNVKEFISIVAKILNIPLIDAM